MNVTCRFNHVTQIYYHSNIIWVCSTTSCRSCDPESDVAPSKHQSSSSRLPEQNPPHSYFVTTPKLTQIFQLHTFINSTTYIFLLLQQYLQPTSEDIIVDLHRCHNSTGYRQFFNLQNIYISTNTESTLRNSYILLNILNTTKYPIFFFQIKYSFTFHIKYLPNMAIMPVFVQHQQ